jgi:hypothetical protein
MSVASKLVGFVVVVETYGNGHGRGRDGMWKVCMGAQPRCYIRCMSQEQERKTGSDGDHRALCVRWMREERRGTQMAGKTWVGFSLWRRGMVVNGRGVFFISIYIHVWADD